MTDRKLKKYEASRHLADSQLKAEELYTRFVNSPNPKKVKEEYSLALEDVMKKLNILVEIIQGEAQEND